MDEQMGGGILELKGISSIIAHLDTPDNKYAFITLFIYYLPGNEISTRPGNK